MRRALALFHRLIPKKNQAFFWAWPDLEDQSRALIPLLVCSSRLSKIIIMASDPERVQRAFAPLGEKVEIVSTRSLAGLLSFLQARYVFTTHRHLVRSYPEDVIAVNLWHGMPVKRIGLMLGNEPDIIARHTVVSSEFWGDVMERSLPSTHGPLVTGMPRNDRLFLPRDAALRKLGLENRDDIRKVVAWLPTYRKSVTGELRVDGEAHDSAFGMEGVEPEALNAFCRERQLFLWIKPHPMAPPIDLKGLSHVVAFSDSDLIDRGISLYEALAASDLLISDVSSVYVDYLILDRPIIHAFPDQSAYQENRGVSFEPLEDYFAGPVAARAAELNAALDAFAQGQDTHQEQRARLRALFFKDTDANACKRLLEAIGL